MNKATDVYEIHSEPDRRGRVRFTKHWLTGYRPGHPVQEFDSESRLPRGQQFFARVGPHIQRSKNAGRKVKVVERLEKHDA